MDISSCSIEDPATSQRLDKYVEVLCEARKHKVGVQAGEISSCCSVSSCSPEYMPEYVSAVT